jgi:glucose uptake protein
MLGFFYAFITVITWGTWISFSQTIPFKNQQIRIFYVALANLVVSFAIAFSQGLDVISCETFWLPFVGGIVWGISGYFALLATHHIGIARAVGIWAPLNIILSIVWGIVLFDEFLRGGTVNSIISVISVSVIIVGILIIIISGNSKENSLSAEQKHIKMGYIAALIAGVLWGSYFIPIRVSKISMWVAAFPMAVGIFVTCTTLVVLSRKSFLLGKSSYYMRVLLSGVLWVIGNYAALKTMEEIGTGKGFTIAQLNVAINAAIGIYIFKNPKPGTRAARLTFVGILVAMIGAIILGNLK